MQKVKKTKLITVVLIAVIMALSFVGIAEFSGAHKNKTPVSVAAETVVWDGSVAAAFDGGAGTAADPHRIANGAQLAYLRTLINAGNATYNANTVHYKLTADIVLNDLSNVANWATEAPINVWTPIGVAGNTFKANLNGNGHTVSGIYISTMDNNQGLFGQAGVGAVIDSIGVTDGYIKGSTDVAGIVGYAFGTNTAGGLGTTVRNSYNSGVRIQGTQYVGGIAGRFMRMNERITNCYNLAAVSGTSTVGGIVGMASGPVETHLAQGQ